MTEQQIRNHLTRAMLELQTADSLARHASGWTASAADSTTLTRCRDTAMVTLARGECTDLPEADPRGKEC